MRVAALASGGLDSTVMVAWLQANGHEVHPVHARYGQRHGFSEWQAFRDVVLRMTGTDTDAWDFLDLDGVPWGSGSALIDRRVAVPDGHYTDATMDATVVPNRNMVLLAGAASLALSRGHGAVAYAAHAGDHTVYADCRPIFVSAMRTALLAVGVDLLTPFVDWTKADIVRWGAHNGVPMSRTWSCYKGGDLHCGTCGTCVERKEAFALANVLDETGYER